MSEGIQLENEEIINNGELIEEPTTEVETPEEPQEQEPQEEPAYEPNFGFKFKDEEFEFDERLRSIVKDKDSEQFVRDLVTAEKAIGEYKQIGGIREIQEKLGNYEEFETGHKQFSELNEEINQLSGMLALNNSAGFESFRKHLGIDKEMVLRWATEEAQGMQNPEMMQQINAQRQLHEQNFNLQYQNNLMHNRQEEQIAAQKHVELDSLLGSNDTSKRFDDLVGTPGSFKQEVIRHGAYIAQTEGRELSIAEAYQEVANRYQGLVANQNSGTNNQVAQNPVQTKSDPQQTVVIRQEGKATIPNVGGGNASPAKKRIANLEQMRALAKSMD